MGSDAERLHLINRNPDQTTVDIRSRPSTGAANTHALYVKQYGRSGQGVGLKVESDNEDEPVVIAQGAGSLLDLRDETGVSKFRVGNDGSLTTPLAVTGDLVIQSVPDATDSDDLPHGYGNSDEPTGLVISSSYPSDDTSGGTDGTGRLNLYSYQRANTYSFGENIRHFLMRSDAKSMQAYYMPVISATDKSGYVAATRDPAAEGVQWRPISWTGSHFEANDHNSIHGHWELEIPDSSGALQGRLEVPFIDQNNDADNNIDDVTIGVDYTNIRTNLADFSVRAQNITTGPYSGQTTCLRVGGANDRSKEIHLSISSAMGDEYRRWVLRANTEDESTGNAGTNFQIARYDDDGTFIDTPVTITRSNGLVTIGGASGTSNGLRVVRDGGIALTVTPLATGGQAVLVTGTDDTAAAYQGNVSGDSVNRYRVFVDGKIEWGSGSASRDTNLYRSAANTLKTDDSFSVGANGTNTTITKLGNTTGDLLTVGTSGVVQVTRASATSQCFTALISGDAVPRLNIDSSGVLNFSDGTNAADTSLFRYAANGLGTDDTFRIGAAATLLLGSSGDVNLYRAAGDRLQTDDKFVAGGGLGTGNSAEATSLGSVTRKMEVFDASGNSLGFVPIYDEIT